MSGSSSAKRQAKQAALDATQARNDLMLQTESLKQEREREKRRASLLMLRSLRAAGGGYFENNPAPLGGTGVLG